VVSLLLVIQTLLERRSAVKEKEEPSALLAEVDLSFPLDLAMAVVRLARSAIVVDLATFLVVGLATFLVVDLATFLVVGLATFLVVDLATFLVVEPATLLVADVATFLVVELASSVAVVDLAKFAPFYLE
jgi:hypothetical protein